MKHKIISAILILAVVFSSALTLSGCGDQDYPVEVANLIIEEEPENIVILDPSAADIISFIGYDVKMVGRSDEVDQEWLSVVPSVGSAAEPDVDTIVSEEASIVFADSTLNSDIKEEIESNDILVITMSEASTAKQLETNYVTLGKILGGEVTGSNKGTEAYNELFDSMDEIKNLAASSKSTDVLYTVCYIYTESNELKIMASGTYGDTLLGYTGAVNAAVNIEDDTLDADTLKIANPNYIFYSDDETLQSIKDDAILSKLSAVKSNNMMMVTMDDMSRQGQTALNTLQSMVEFMYPELAQSDSSTADETSDTSKSDSSSSSSSSSKSSEESSSDKSDADD